MLLSETQKRNPVVKFDGRILQRTNSINYLGVELEETWLIWKTLRNICLKFDNRMISIALTSYKLPISMIQLYNDAILMLIAVYAANVWCHGLVQNKSCASTLNGVQRKFSLRLAGVFRTVSGESLQVIMGVFLLHLLVLRRWVRYLIRKEM